MEGEEEVELCPYLDTDISILLQSIVMVVQGKIRQNGVKLLQ